MHVGCRETDPLQFPHSLASVGLGPPTLGGSVSAQRGSHYSEDLSEGSAALCHWGPLRGVARAGESHGSSDHPVRRVPWQVIGFTGGVPGVYPFASAVAVAC